MSRVLFPLGPGGIRSPPPHPECKVCSYGSTVKCVAMVLHAVATRSTAWARGFSFVGILGSSPAEDMFV